MLVKLLQAKIHRATVTDADLDYEGSVTVDEGLMEQAGVANNQHVDIYNITNGARFSTYIIPGAKGSGVVCLNGAAARLVSKGDLVILAFYSLYTPEEAKEHKPIVLLVDEKNRVKERIT